MEIYSELERFIRCDLLHDEGGQPIGTTDDLLESGVLDSAGIAQVLSFLEGRYGVTVADEELVAENFETIEAIAALVVAKTATRD